MSYYNYYLCIIYLAPEGQIVMVLLMDGFVFFPSPPSSSSLLSCPLFFSPGRAEKTTVWEEGTGGGGGGVGWTEGGRFRVVGAAAICKSFIYIWHLHNEAGSQWQRRPAADRVACLQF